MKRRHTAASSSPTSHWSIAMHSRSFGLGQQSSNPSLRRLILVSLDWTRTKDPRIPLGQASLLAALQADERIDVQPLSFPVNAEKFDPKYVLEAILNRTVGWEANAVDVGIGTYIWNEEYVQFLLAQLRARGFRGRIILGGPQISYSGKGLESLYPQADVFVRGYGEEALVSLALSSEPRPIKGVHYAGTEDLELTAEVDLETLPSPWLDAQINLPASQWFVRWETQRGCPYRCTFCQHREADARPRLRRMDQDRLLDEIRLFVRSGVWDVAVLDPIFNLGKRSVQLLNAFRDAGFQGRLSLQCRFETLREDFLDACAGLNVRLEFGLQTIHEKEERVIERPNRLDRVKEALSSVKRRKIPYEVSIIFGLPEQTLKSFRETVEFCLDEKIPVIKAYPLQLLRGTPLERDRATWGLVENEAAIPSVVRSHTFDERDWLEMARLAEALDQTEGEHPETLEELDALVAARYGSRLPERDAGMKLALGRWSPTSLAV